MADGQMRAQTVKGRHDQAVPISVMFCFIWTHAAAFSSTVESHQLDLAALL